MNIRKCRIEDSDTIYRLMCELEETILDKSGFAEAFSSNINDKSICYLVAVVEDKITGFISLHTHSLLHHASKVAEIQEFIITNSIRGQKIGTALFNAICDKAVEMNCKEIEVTSNVRRYDAHRFYTAHGMINTHLKFTLNLKA